MTTTTSTPAAGKRASNTAGPAAGPATSQTTGTGNQASNQDSLEVTGQSGRPSSSSDQPSGSVDGVEPRWLSEEDQRTWLALGSVLLRLPGALDAQLQRDAGISHFEYVVMAALSESPERTLRMSILAVMAESGLPRLSQVVTRLEKRGWVKRSPDPTDGRSTLATLTEDGWDKVVASAPGHVEEVRRLVFDPLTKAQLRQLNEISRRVITVIDPDDRCLR
ncbi:MarR family winged helix-turn-helix transcriptional regulator [Arthrobacter sedimenti]|uniref:MarR family winged helix-turn-helix transcriptional regulator n=1 Tax=Arthrobacter sedimenti TaxID=2694931 RepID=UPI000B357A02|nr:MarR family transcriptional regulator [Arthrobacter sedimenti]OUM44651.1 MarR family transcriptional regulator [Arthrobacter agilis]